MTECSVCISYPSCLSSVAHDAYFVGAHPDLYSLPFLTKSSTVVSGIVPPCLTNILLFPVSHFFLMSALPHFWIPTVPYGHVFSKDSWVCIILSTPYGPKACSVSCWLPSDLLIAFTPSVLEKQNTMLWEILQNILSILFIGIYRIFHILSFLKMLVLLQFYMMALIASSTNYFFHSLISTHFHGHTLNLIIICILIRLPCSQKPSFTPDWLIPLLTPWFAFINFVSISSPLFPPFV